MKTEPIQHIHTYSALEEIENLKTYIKQTEIEQNKHADAWSYADYLTGQINVARNTIKRLQDEVKMQDLLDSANLSAIKPMPLSSKRFLDKYYYSI